MDTHTRPHDDAATLRPSEYTAALIQALLSHLGHIRGKRVLEIGPGSGVILVLLAQLKAAHLCGVDIELAAVGAARELLSTMGYGSISEILHGDMWEPVEGRRFDVIVANLPHFPMKRCGIPGRLKTWSAGGEDGRSFLDPFLRGLADHLAPHGRAIITHNAFVGLERSRRCIAGTGLALRELSTTLICIPPGKIERMTPSILEAESREGGSILQIDSHVFAKMHIVEIGFDLA